MSGLDIVYSFFWFIAGVGVFLYGIKMMGEGLETVAGENIKKMFGKMDKNVFSGLGIGIATTSIVQSSSAVTVMTVGFVNAGFMSLLQATGIIFGANIGTTITAQLMAFGYGGVTNINLTVFFAAFAGIGAFMSMSKKDLPRKLGAIFVGLGMLFVGLSVMGNSTKSFSASPEIVSLICAFKNPVLLILAGVLVTALIQSSSAVSGIIIAMSASGILCFEQGMFLIVGSNIGTCVTALISAIGTGINAKRVSLIHLFFNITGALLFLLTNLFVPYEKLLTSAFQSSEVRIAMLHTFFNIGTVIFLLPFSKLLVKFVTIILPERKKKEEDYGKHFYYVDYNLLETPAVAVQQTKREIENMLRLSMINFRLAMDAIILSDTAMKESFYKTEDIINFLNIEVTKFLSCLSGSDLSAKDHAFISASYHTLSDAERIGDHAVNIMEFAEHTESNGIIFSEESKEEMSNMLSEVNKLYEFTSKIYSDHDLSYLPLVLEHEDKIDELKALMGRNHISRLSEGVCTPEAGAIYLNLASNCERIGDHLRNIAILAKGQIRQK